MENTKSCNSNDRLPYRSDYSALGFWEKNREDLKNISRMKFDSSFSIDKPDISYFKDSRFKSRMNGHFESITS